MIRVKTITLTEQQSEAIEQIIKENTNKNFAKQAKAIQLLSNNYSILEITAILEIHVQTFYHWHRQWHQKGLDFFINRAKTSEIQLTTDQIEILNTIVKNSDDKVAVRRAKAILMYSQNYKPKDIQAALSLSQSTLSKWLKAWNQEGIQSLQSKHKAQAFRITPEESAYLDKLISQNPDGDIAVRAKAIKLLAEGKSINKIATVLSVSHQTISNWRHFWREHGITWINKKHHKIWRRSKTKIRFTPKQLEIIQFIIATCPNPTFVKQAEALLMLYDRYTVNETSTRLSIKPATIYSWTKRWQIKKLQMFFPPTKHKKTTTRLVLKLTPEQAQILQLISENTENSSFIKQAKALLMIHEKHSTEEITGTLLIQSKTLYKWLKQWRTKKLQMFVKPSRLETNTTKIILNLSPEQVKILRFFTEHINDNILKTQAQALLMAHEKYPIETITISLSTDQKTISDWTKRWNKNQLSMFTKPESTTNSSLKIELHLTTGEVEKLQSLIDQENSEFTKEAGALFLIHYGHPIRTIAGALSVGEETIYSWIAQWHIEKFQMFTASKDEK